jgi:hypothetical protein
MSPSFKEYLASSYPVLYCQTHELHRAITVFGKEAETLDFHCYDWDCQNGIRDLTTSRYKAMKPENIVGEICELARKSIVFAQNFNHFWDDPFTVQDLLNRSLEWKATAKILMVLSPRLAIPMELEKITALVDFKYPDTEQLFAILEGVAQSAEIEVPQNSGIIIEAALGLTAFEAENAFTLSAIYDEFNPKIISDHKMQMVKKTGLLEVWEPWPLEDLGGMANLKQYLANRKEAFRNPDLPRLRGNLLLGVSGTGKSLAAKVAASIFEVPLVRLDIPALKSSLVGSSEQNVREATKILDAIQSAVLWLDEVEKMLSGAQSSGMVDAGTTMGMLSHLLTWMAESKSRIYIMATANSLRGLPPEFLRAGRFDALWFIDLPNSQEISEIIKIMNKRYGTEIPTNWASKLRGYTGAEIEQLARDSIFDGLEEAYKNIVPLERTMAEEIKDLRSWAVERARMASGPDIKKKQGREIQKLDPRAN